jgi:glucose dehydrogenase
VLFIGATPDRRFHAYDSRTGKLLWETLLPAPAEANPITYLGNNGRQYVVWTPAIPSWRSFCLDLMPAPFLQNGSGCTVTSARGTIW